MSTVAVSRAIRALLGGMMGTFASGHLRVYATGPGAFLPPRSFAAPVRRGAFTDDAAVFVGCNPSHPDGKWPISESGTDVPVQAMLGGIGPNAEEGDHYVWFPEPPGIVRESELVQVSGGEDSPAFGALRQVNAYKNLGASALDYKAFFQAQLGQYPAASLAWERTTPLDGPMVAAPGPRQARLGQSRMKMRHSWLLYLVTTRFENEETRRVEGEVLRDEVVAELYGRTGTRGLRISNDPGVNIIDASVTQVTDASYIDVIRFETIFVISQRNAQEGDANPWLTTRIARPIPPDSDTQDEIALPDVTVSMVPKS